MSAPGQRRERRQGRPSAPPVGRARGADGVERDVYEDADGRQYVLGDQGEKVFGLWVLTITERPSPSPPHGTPPTDQTKRDGPPKEASDEGADRPWERAGAVRRDREPHRGRMLSLLATVAFCLGVMALPCGPLGLPGLGLGLYVRSAARRDLRKMDEGVMDPDGVGPTRAALQDANLASALSAAGVLLTTITVVGLLFCLT